MQASINSNKHFIPVTNQSIANGAILNTTVVDAVILSSASAAVENVQEGAKVLAIHFEAWIQGDEVSGNSSQFILTIEKRPSGVTAMSHAQSLNLQTYGNKKNILYTTQGVLSSGSDGQSVPVVREWIIIPKGKQRMGLSDKVTINIAAVGKLRTCGIHLYKEYR